MRRLLLLRRPWSSLWRSSRMLLMRVERRAGTCEDLRRGSAISDSRMRWPLLLRSLAARLLERPRCCGGNEPSLLVPLSPLTRGCRPWLFPAERSSSTPGCLVCLGLSTGRR